MNSIFKWVATVFLFLLFAILAFNAFVGNDLGDTHYNKIIGLMVAIYGWLFHTFGSIITGFLFVACAIGIVVAAVMDKGIKQEIE